MISSFHIVTVCGGAAGYSMCVCAPEKAVHTHTLLKGACSEQTPHSLCRLCERSITCVLSCPKIQSHSFPEMEKPDFVSLYQGQRWV